MLPRESTFVGGDSAGGGLTLASPLYGHLRELPPLLMHVGDEEVLLDDTTRFAQRARAAGAFASVLPEGREAIAKIGDFLGRWP